MTEIPEKVKETIREKLQYLNEKRSDLLNRITELRLKIEQIDIERSELEDFLRRTRQGDPKPTPPKEETTMNTGHVDIQATIKEQKIPRCIDCDDIEMETNGVYKKSPEEVYRRWKCPGCGSTTKILMESPQESIGRGTKDQPPGKRGDPKIQFTGKSKKLRWLIKPRLASGEGVLIQDIMEETGESNGLIYGVLDRMVQLDPGLEWYKDHSKKYSPQGVRIADKTLREKARKQSTIDQEYDESSPDNTEGDDSSEEKEE